MQKRDSPVKVALRWAYRQFCGVRVVLSRVSQNGNVVEVHYGGAVQGNVGGPLVKVKRLNEYFPEKSIGFNLVYLLSNAPYLPKWALTNLNDRRIPIVLNQNGVFYPAWYDGDWEFQNRIMADAYHASDWVFYQSAFCRRAAERFLGERKGPSEILFNAVNTAHFVPRASVLEPRRTYTFLLAGKISNHLTYRLVSTIRGLAYARESGLDAVLLIAGWVERDARVAAETLARKLGVSSSVSYAGPYRQEDAPKVYQSADAYVITKHNDPCPSTVIEAMSCGLPILYSNTGGVPELVGDSAGIGLPCPQDLDQVHVPDPKAVGEGMLKVAGSHQHYSLEARRLALKNFCLDNWIARHRRVFETLLGH